MAKFILIINDKTNKIHENIQKMFLSKNYMPIDLLLYDQTSKNSLYTYDIDSNEMNFGNFMSLTETNDNNFVLRSTFYEMSYLRKSQDGLYNIDLFFPQTNIKAGHFNLKMKYTLGKNYHKYQEYISSHSVLSNDNFIYISNKDLFTMETININNCYDYIMELANDIPFHNIKKHEYIIDRYDDILSGTDIVL